MAWYGKENFQHVLRFLMVWKDVFQALSCTNRCLVWFGMVWKSCRTVFTMQIMVWYSMVQFQYSFHNQNGFSEA